MKGDCTDSGRAYSCIRTTKMCEKTKKWKMVQITRRQFILCANACTHEAQVWSSLFVGKALPLFTAYGRVKDDFREKGNSKS